jgi:RIO-like serine/threonine protein kinase
LKSDYKILKIFEKKSTRFTALIEYKNKKAIYKKLTTKNNSLVDKFLNEINILITIDKSYIPKVYEHGNDYIIMEYFEAYDNKPEEFKKYATIEIIDNIVGQLIDINTTSLDNIKPTANKFLYKIYKTVLKLWLNRCFKLFHIKALLMLTTFYIKNKDLFNLPVATKGDFTEVNILVKDDEVKFIDFDTYKPNGAWLQDASYLLLHQDVEVEKLTWQTEFFKKYILKINEKNIELNSEYIRFWLLYTSINQFSIRHNQHKNKLILFENNELEAKEQHIKYFLDNKKFNTFLEEIGIK